MAYSEAKVVKELSRLEEKSKSKNRWFHLFIFSFFILCLAYVIDEIASNVNSIVQNDVVKTFYPGEQGTTIYLIVSTLCSGIAFFTFFYKSLSDRFGRKLFLIVNTIGLSIGMFICFLSKNVVFYTIGMLIMSFFMPCHIQEVYILETANPRRRALFLSIAKAIGTVGVVLVSALHDWAISLGNNTWNYVFLIPACIGLLTGIICFFFIKESPVFIESRTKILKEKLKNNGVIKKIDNAEGGIIHAIKYMFKYKVLLWIFLIAIMFSVSAVGALNFGFMISDVKDQNLVFIIYPFACAFLQITIGLVADLFGRKKASLSAGVLSLIGIIIFSLGSFFKFPAAILGITLGIFIAGYNSLLNLINVICSEQSPTNLRSSIMSLIGVATSIGSFIPIVLLIIIGAVSPNFNISLFVIFMVAPSILAGVILLFIFVPETYHVSLSSLKDKLKIKTKKQSKNN